jgi:hypothetical protein
MHRFGLTRKPVDSDIFLLRAKSTRLNESIHILLDQSASHNLKACL